MNTKNYLITGCAGFIGSHTADVFIDHDCNVFGIDAITYAGNRSNINSSIKFFEGRIEDNAFIKSICIKEKIDVIINFAAETHVDNSIKNVIPFLKTNIEGVASVLDVCKDLCIPLIHISTDEVYGPCKEFQFDENKALNPKNPYAASKAAADHLIDAYSNTYGIKYLICRPTNNFGERQYKEKFIPSIISSLKDNKKIKIYGNGTQQREWLHVDITAKAIYYLTIRELWNNQIINIGKGQEATNKELVEMICKITNINFYDSVEFIKDRPGHDARYSIDCTKLKNLGFDQKQDRLYNTLEDLLKKENII